MKKDATVPLKAAIALHKKHMDGTAPTTGKDGMKSQMLMMSQMEAALAILQDDSMLGMSDEAMSVM